VISLLTLGAITTSFINIPIFIDHDMILAVNFGSVVIPIVISLFFIYKLKLNLIIISILIIVTSLITYLLAFIDPSIGIVINFPNYLIIIFFCLMLSILMPKKSYSNSKAKMSQSFDIIPISYSICTLGVFIGTDILWLPYLVELKFNVGFIGGLGIFDLIFISGIYTIFFSILLQILLHSFEKGSKKVSKPVVKPSNIDHIQLATLKARISAFMIDIGLQFGLVSILFIFIIKDQPEILSNSIFNIIRGEQWIIFVGWVWTIHITYHILFEWYSGQTPGKMIMNIRVMALPMFDKRNKNYKNFQNSREINRFMTIFTRNIIRLIDFILGFFLISIYFILSTKKSQRIGDYFASSVVIWNK
jgi:uncharacterized membrane protein/uncharacterized RDD family membrane protein YckC